MFDMQRLNQDSDSESEFINSEVKRSKKNPDEPEDPRSAKQLLIDLVS